MENRQDKFQLGMIGLGVMGRNLVLNMVEHGCTVAGYDKDLERVRLLGDEGGEKVFAAETIKDFINALSSPRIIMMLVPAGPPVDAVLGSLRPYLRNGDIVIDGGNSLFTDTRLRQITLGEDGISLLGVGISGGAEGARHGPSIMPGGPSEAYELVHPIFQAIAAKVDGEPCVTYCGPGPAGHYVKMVHNGIEYGLMRLISETYSFMKRAMGLSNDELHDVFAEWNKTEIGGFLIEITAEIFLKVDERTGQRLIDFIRPVAGQKGTGMWTSQEAMELQVPVPTMDMGVTMRDLSAFESDRLAASKVLKGPAGTYQGDQRAFLEQLRGSLHASMLLTYIQGMSLLHTASSVHAFNFDLEKITRIWRGGCIIRSRLLEKIRAAYQAQPGLSTLLLDPAIAADLSVLQEQLRTVVGTAIKLGISMSASGASLGYYDTFRAAQMPANLIQAQRDFFGAHTYERTDRKGVFHTEWKPA